MVFFGTQVPRISSRAQSEPTSWPRQASSDEKLHFWAFGFFEDPLPALPVTAPAQVTVVSCCGLMVIDSPACKVILAASERLAANVNKNAKKMLFILSKKHKTPGSC